MSQYIDQIREISHRFFELSGLSLESLEIICEDEERHIYGVKVRTPDSKLAIGIHGQNLQAMKHLLVRMVERSVGDSVILHLEINDYLQSRDERFFKYLDGRVDYVLRTKKETDLPNLTAYERKKAHSYVADRKIEGLRTYSSGEGKDRMLHIGFTKMSTLDLDDDGVGI